MTQIARLHIRGSLVNKTARNLTPTEQAQVSQLMQTAWDDPRLENARHEFCQALARTIGNEYLDKEYGMEEAWITFWRTAVDALFHAPKPRVVEDGEIRIKHFKTCLFNYLRQILKENKIPTHLADRKISGPADYVAREMVQGVLEGSTGQKIPFEETKGVCTFVIETNLFPLPTMQKLWKIRDEFETHQISITIEETHISISPTGASEYVTKKVSERIRVNAVSLNGLEGDNEDRPNSFQQHCEYQAAKRSEDEVDQMTINDAIQALRERLPDSALPVFDLLYDPPLAFLDRFYPNRKSPNIHPKDTHIAKWLEISDEEVENAKNMIKEQALALDIG